MTEIIDALIEQADLRMEFDFHVPADLGTTLIGMGQDMTRIEGHQPVFDPMYPADYWADHNY